MVTVLMFGQTLQQCVDEPEIQCEVSDSLTVRELLESNRDMLGEVIQLMNNSQLMVTVNQKVVTLEARVKDGDTVKLTHQVHPEHEGMFWHNP